MKTDETTGTVPESPFNMDDFGDAIGQAVAKGIASTQPPKKVSNGEYIRRMKLKNPKPPMKRPAMQNGMMVPEEACTAKAIVHMNRITHSGRYIDRLVEVILHEQGSESMLDIRYSNKSADQRLMLAQKFRSFEELVGLIADAQEVEDAEDAKTGKTRRAN